MVYVDNDPLVSLRAEALMTGSDVDGVLSGAGELLDFAGPVGVQGTPRYTADPRGRKIAQ